MLTSLGALLSQRPTVFDYIDVFASLLPLIGLAGLAFRKAVFTAAFWRVMFVILVAWDLAYNVLISRLLGLGQHGFATRVATGVAGYVLGLAVLVPVYFALFLYAYRRRQVWGRIP